MDSSPRRRPLTWLLPLALVALACAREPDAPRATSTPSTVDGSAAPRLTYVLPTQVVRTATPVGAMPVATRYLGRCAGSVCELLSAAESRVAAVPGYLENWSPDRKRVARAEVRPAAVPPVAPGLGEKPAVVGSLAFIVSDTDDSRDVAEVRRAEREAPAVWSPDGTLLAISSPLAGEGIGVAESIEIVRANGSGGWTLVEGKSASEPGGSRTNVSPSWSPDGREVAFVSWLSQPDNGLFVSSVDAPSPRRMPIGNLTPIQVAWLPGGQLALLAFVPPDRPQPPRDPGPPPELFVVNPDGTQLRRLTEGGAYVDGDGRRPLVVSADGRCIAYRTDDYEELVTELRVVCLDGRSSRITRDRIGDPPPPGLVSYYAWLTDSRLAVLGTGECAGLLAVRVETEERDCVVY